MIFEISEPIIKVDETVKVNLTLGNSIFRNNVIYLKANGAIIMGFSNGMYCRYSDAVNHSSLGTIKGLSVDSKGKIVESPCSF